jgi:hypothetical protein
VPKKLADLPERERPLAVGLRNERFERAPGETAPSLLQLASEIFGK